MSQCPECHAPEGSPHATECNAAPKRRAEPADPLTSPSAVVPVPATSRGIEIRSLSELETFAFKAAKSVNLKPDEAIVVMQAGMEAGLTPLRSLQSLYLTQGRVNWYAKAAWGLVLSKDVMLCGPGSDPDAWLELDGTRVEAATVQSKDFDRLVGCFQTHRMGWTKPKTTRYGATQAKAQGLWKKSGSGWDRTPDRMLLAAAKRRHLDDWYDDVLMGIAAGQSVEDARAEIDVTPLPAQAAPAGPDPLMAKLQPEPDPDPGPPAEKSVPNDAPAPRVSSQPEADEAGNSTPQPQEPAATYTYSDLKCAGCERMIFLLGAEGHRADCPFIDVGPRVPTQDEIDHMG